MFFKNFVRLGFAGLLLSLIIGAPASEAQSKSAAMAITVYQDPGWGCCSAWVGHLQENGFKIDKKNVTGKELVDVKIKNNVPQKLYSCHTAIVQGYVIEGHVPADLIYRLLKEKPEVAGLAVPGMPVGSPGMEGVNPQPYDVLAFDKHGKTSIYARR
jgi:hypothetical protein